MDEDEDRGGKGGAGDEMPSYYIPVPKSLLLSVPEPCLERAGIVRSFSKS